MPEVSVIIPTTGRPELVLRAVRSVLAQTVGETEVIVAVDGPNPQTLVLLSAVGDPRLKIVQNPSPLGPGAARNAAAEVARGQWLAFLDDDDEWLPQKLEEQLAVAGDPADNIVVTCLSRVETPSGTYVWPRRVYCDEMPLSEYLFDRRSLFMGDAYVPTSSLLMPRALFLDFKFPPLRYHEDWDLLLRLSVSGNARLVTVAAPLVRMYQQQGRASLSETSAWRTSLDWANACRALLTRRAYSGFCLTIAGPEAARAGEYRALSRLLRLALRHGSPTPAQLALFMAVWVIPMRLRRLLRGVWYRAASKPTPDLGGSRAGQQD